MGILGKIAAHEAAKHFLGGGRVGVRLHGPAGPALDEAANLVGAIGHPRQGHQGHDDAQQSRSGKLATESSRLSPGFRHVPPAAIPTNAPDSKRHEMVKDFFKSQKAHARIRANPGRAVIDNLPCKYYRC